MSVFFWTLYVVNAVFAGLVVLALPHGANFIYAIMAGSLLGMVFLLARTHTTDRQPQPRQHHTHSPGL